MIIVLILVALGMPVRPLAKGFAAKSDRPVRIFSIFVPVFVAIGALLGEKENLVAYFQQVGLTTVLFCLISLSLGYLGARMARLGTAQAIASSMEIGIHNTKIALSIALGVLNSAEVDIPAVIYSIVMYILAPLSGIAITRGHRRVKRQEHAEVH